eukprot:3327951-Prorocentrum_lima.AAC.1
MGPGDRQALQCRQAGRGGNPREEDRVAHVPRQGHREPARHAPARHRHARPAHGPRGPEHRPLAPPRQDRPGPQHRLAAGVAAPADR